MSSAGFASTGLQIHSPLSASPLAHPHKTSQFTDYFYEDKQSDSDDHSDSDEITSSSYPVNLDNSDNSGDSFSLKRLVENVS